MKLDIKQQHLEPALRAAEHPIIFSGPMVRAILEGRKTQTRRVVKPQPDSECVMHCNYGQGWSEGLRCPYGLSGDRLWVRETWAPCISGPCELGNPVLYRADEDDDYEKLTWTPSIHMPRWASRITLELTGVRVERLQDITTKDIIAEGAFVDSGCGLADEEIDELARDQFQQLWDGLNAKRGFPWASNPWVWVLEFKLT